METFVIKLLVMVVLAVVFGLTIWLSPRFFGSDGGAATRAGKAAAKSPRAR